MENVRSLSLEEMGKVSGGSLKTVTKDKAEVRSGAGLSYGLAGTLSCGAQVNFTGEVTFNNEDSITWYFISSPIMGWVKRSDIGR